MVIANPAALLPQVRFTQEEREFVYGVALKYLKDADAAHDVAQEALLLAFRYRLSFRGKSRFTTWLYRIAATSALMHLRRARRQPQGSSVSLDDEGSLAESCATQPSPEEQSSSGETLARCAHVVAELGVKYPPVFHLRFIEGCSEAETALRLGLTLGAVKTRAQRARLHVKRRLCVAANARRPAMLRP